MKRLLPICILVLIVTSFSSAQVRFYVKPGAPSSNSGDSWANATNLQRALQQAWSGGEIWLQEGVYYPDEGFRTTDNDRNSTFLIDANQNVYGGFDGTETCRTERDPENNLTILSGDIDGNDNDGNGDGIIEDYADQNGNNAYTVVTITAGNRSAVLDGLYITAGKAEGSSPEATKGAGLYAREGSSPRIEHTTFIGNYAIDDGGAIYLDDTVQPYLFDMNIKRNYSGNNGGGIFRNSVDGWYERLNFISNKAEEGGGALYSASDGANTTFMNLAFRANVASHGGALFTIKGVINIQGSLFSGNYASTAGGAIYNGTLVSSCLNCRIFLYHCTLSGNDASNGGSAVYNNTIANNAILNSIVWNNSSAGGQVVNVSTQTEYTSSILEGGFDTRNKNINNSVSVDPLFLSEVDPAEAPSTAGNYRISSTSSPAYDQSIVTSSIDTMEYDLDTKKRKTGNYREWGAFEYNSPDFNFMPDVINPLQDITLFPGFATYEINLCEVFEDPEDANLNYSVINNTNSKVAAVSITNNVLSLTENGEGTTTITINADDGNVSAEDVFSVTILSGATDYGAKLDGIDSYLETSITDLSGDELTLEFIFKGSDYSSAIRQQNQNGEYIISPFANGRHVFSFSGGTSGGVNADNGGDGQNGEWHHFAVTWEKGDFLKSYFDGYPLGSVMASSTSIPNILAEVLLGSRLGRQDFLEGIIDEVRIWNDVRTRNEILANANRLPNPDTESNLVAYWNFNSGTGEKVEDISQNTYKATMRNGVVLIPVSIPKFENLPPTDISLNNDTIAENQAPGTEVGTFTTSDPDVSDTFVYSLVAGDGDDDNEHFSIDGDKLKANMIFDYEKKINYVIRVRTEDARGQSYEKAFSISVTDGSDDLAMHFQGNEYIDIDGFTTPDKGTVEFLIKLDDLNTSKPMFILGQHDPSGSSNGFDLVEYQGFITFKVKNNNVKSEITSTTNISDGEWHHVLAIYEFGGDMELFIDGVSEATQSSIVEVTVTDSPLRIGKSVDSYWNEFKGEIDQIRIWKRKITNEELSCLTSQDIPADTIGLMGFWNFNDAYQDTVRDYTLNSFDGTLTGQPEWLPIGIALKKAPTRLILSDNIVTENQEAGTLVADLSAEDPDNPDSFTFSLETGKGDTNNEDFKINLNQLLTAKPLNYEDESSKNIRIRIEDEYCNSSEFEISINVEDANDPPNLRKPLNDTIFQEGFESTSFHGPDLFEDEDFDFLSFSSSSSNTSVINSSTDRDMISLIEVGTGQTTLSIIASDNTSSKTAELSIFVNSAPDNIKSIENILLSEAFSAEEIDLSIYFSDPNDDPITYEASSSDESILTVDISDDNLILEGADSGTAIVSITAHDSRGGKVATSFSATVNLLPVVDAPVSNQNETRGFGSIEFDLTEVFSDPENDEISLSALSSDETVATVELNGSILTIDEAGLGSTVVTVSANDGYGTTEMSFTLEITEEAKMFQSIEFTEVSDRIYGDPSFELVMSTSSGLEPSISVTAGQSLVTLNGKEVTVLGAGQVTVLAEQEGNDEYYAADPVEQSFTVEKAAVSITADDQAITYGEDLPALTSSYSGFVNGEDATVLDEEPQISTSAVPDADAGTYPITLSGGSDDNYTFSFTEGTLTIEQAAQTITFEEITEVDIAGQTSISLSASASSGLIVTYTLIEGDGSIEGNTLSLNSTGNFVVEASQPGNTNYLPAESVTQSFFVTDSRKEAQSISFDPVTGATYGDQISLSATATSGLEVSYLLLSGAGSIENEVLTLTGTGPYEVRATQSGNEAFNPAEPVSISFEAGKATLNVKAVDQAITQGDPLPELEMSFDGFKLEDDALVIDDLPAITTDATTQSLAGNYEIILSGGSDDHYELNLLNGTLVIEEAGEVLSTDPEDVDVSVYPNPFTDRITIESGGSFDVHLYHINGSLLRSSIGTAAIQMELSGLSRGSYLVEIITDKKVETKRIIKQ